MGKLKFYQLIIFMLLAMGNQIFVGVQFGVSLLFSGGFIFLITLVVIKSLGLYPEKSSQIIDVPGEYLGHSVLKYPCYAAYTLFGIVGLYLFIMSDYPFHYMW